MIQLQGLTKVFPNGKGIFDITFTVEKGEVFGFLGPNGAGKSTTIRHLMGFMKPTKGTASINNFNCWNEASSVQKHIGYLPGEISFLEGMTGFEFLNLLAGMRGMKNFKYRDELIERLQFDVHTPIRKMSKGMKQKVGIVAAFMHDPEVIILDEPTSGLDPLMQQTFIEIVLEEKKKGKTFFMSSHSFPEIERTCDRAAIIKDGRIIAVKNIHELQSMQRKLFDVVLTSESEVQDLLQSPLDIISHNGNRVRIAVQGNYDTFIRELAKYNVQSMDVHVQSLEDIFMNYYDRRGDER
ncbi:ABC transporter ATP-binding protein [Thermaerobacillus caldiproteolyticus]|uniref:ABC-2 type transport system ATP-binding protein n=1 Tax=Thermaerobacillus caldiproteolyticus TaxID=247480 RepID=A0A7V9Z7R3_9BACL|nr:ABC transporter ATP-binding protein [Anoxybacillus caldiproteolyticus]MBA2875505.1 ABC-2 type transport system ATP-binding protein [Anoxybacillus caldiproteolyticus]